MFRLQKKSKEMVLINSWVLCGHWSRQILAEAEKHGVLVRKKFWANDAFAGVVKTIISKQFV